MIVDIHTHIFPPKFVEERERLAAHDPQFGAMYASEKAIMATAEDLRESMRTAGVSVSVVCGFWWQDPELAAEHAQYLGDVAAQSDGSMIAFAPTFDRPDRCAGIGEVRLPDHAEFPATDAPMLVHCSEEVGHLYPGKSGGLSPGGLWRLLQAQPRARVIAAHWGAGFPFFGLMPEVARILEEGRLLVDTAATSYLYQPEVFRRGIELIGTRNIAWGSDYPLRSQSVDLGQARDALRTDGEINAILGGNAARFLGLEG
ncbi:MAG: amidohydrolase family protein [Dehalococcoidia bacterium]|nr:amidohydrolase family protein [Dehalococcoidia bacterium]